MKASKVIYECIAYVADYNLIFDLSKCLRNGVGDLFLQP